MGKNWLIRTKSNHILGPVSKEKVQELYQNGSIKPDDEICSGNGYWFFIRESDLVNKYLMGTQSQSFNPISEAKDVLTTKNLVPNDDEIISQDDITLVGHLNINQLREDEIHLQKIKDQNGTHQQKNREKLDHHTASNSEKVSEEIQKKK